MSKMEIREITGTIYLKTGLHIGAGKEGVEIGGIDSPVVKDSRDGFPYVPGSSLKGKIRSLLEHREGRFGGDGSKECGCGDCYICALFGSLKSKRGPTRVIFRDAFLSDESKEMLMDRDLLATEVKTETAIDRKVGTARGGSLRFTERVIAGLSFDFSVSLRVMEGDGETLQNLLLDGLELIQKDALGGNTSRGYGRVQLKDLSLDGKPLAREVAGT